jgi:hypothetical protein
VSIAILIAAVFIICGVFVVAKGGGGELARDRTEMPVEPDIWTGTEVARFRPPPALLGYDPGATEWAFSVIGRSIDERDEEIAWLRGRLAELQPETMPTAGVLAGREGSSPGPATARDRAGREGSSRGEAPAAVGSSASQPDEPAPESAGSA